MLLFMFILCVKLEESDEISNFPEIAYAMVDL